MKTLYEWLREPVAERFSGEQELEQKAKAGAVRRAGVQTVETCSTGKAPTVQTGTACEDRDAEAEGLTKDGLDLIAFTTC